MFVLAVGAYGCATSSSSVKHSGQEQAKPMPGRTFVTEAPEEPATNGLECFVKVYTEKNFGGASVILRPADMAFVKYADLESVPEGRGTNWGKELDSLEVGKCAKAEVYAQTNFRGASQTINPGLSVEDISLSNLANGINSIKISCACAN